VCEPSNPVPHTQSFPRGNLFLAEMAEGICSGEVFAVFSLDGLKGLPHPFVSPLTGISPVSVAQSLWLAWLAGAEQGKKGFSWFQNPPVLVVRDTAFASELWREDSY